MFVPDTIILDSSTYVRIAREHLSRLTLHQLEVSEFINRLVTAVSYKHIANAQLLLCVSSIKDEYSQCFDQDELGHFASILLQLGIAIHQHLLKKDVYMHEAGIFPYHVTGMIGDDIVLVFDYRDYSDDESALW